MSRQRIAASCTLEILQNISLNYSDSDGSDSKMDPVVNAALASVPAVEPNELDSDNETDDQVTHSVVQGGPGLIQGSLAISQYPAILVWTYIIFHKSC